ncbi:putative nuclease HARBI1 [Chionoecetes opilio]|uniref:Putative nuclease HARBI1 n=1 Tax=Chionoecetes opilio TaxID=41210 RepID=A0A8J4Y537_CHIOP|nr:putative nuclease HARBI1 [Chionoecetes opilio]
MHKGGCLKVSQLLFGVSSVGTGSDNGYHLESFVMTPVKHPTTIPEEWYNRGHTRTRVTVEQTFGILKSRFRCLHKSGGALQYTPLKCCKIIASCLLLHNRCVRHGVPEPQQLEENEQPKWPLCTDVLTVGQVVLFS